MLNILLLLFASLGIALAEQTDVCSQVHVMSQYCTSQGVVANGTGDLITRQELDAMLEIRLKEIEERLRLNLQSPPPVNYTLIEQTIHERFQGVEDRIIQQLGEPPEVNYTAIDISINERFERLEAMVNGDGGTSESIVDYRYIESKIDERFGEIRAHVDRRFDQLLNSSEDYQNALDELNRRTNVTDCREIRLEDAKICNATGGLFDIYRGPTRYELFCDTYTDGGGWTVFQRRMDGSVDFNRTWIEYVEGFGDRHKEFWLGLKTIHALLSTGTHELRIDMTNSFGSVRFIKYGAGLLQRKSRMGSFSNQDLQIKRNSAKQKNQQSSLNSLLFTPNPDLPKADCRKIISGDYKEIEDAKLANLMLMRTKKFEEIKKSLLQHESLMQLTRNCDDFVDKRKYITESMTKEEEDFPIAYVITIHRDVMSFERLLRAIYQPHNIYCVHVDLKSDESFHQDVRNITRCFDNVFVASNLTSVRYTHFSRVQADINCMRDLVNISKTYKWRYAINLCGQDFPLKTNFEIVRHLKSLGGYNNMETFHTPGHKKKRFELKFNLPKDGSTHSVMERTTESKEPPPGGIEIFSGSAYFIFKREAVEYIVKDPLIQELFNWSHDTYSPDEFLWATIQRMYPDVPGSLPTHIKYDLNELNSKTRLVKWSALEGDVYPKCGGQHVRGICVYGCSDLAWLTSKNHLYANKFDPEVDYYAIECLDNWMRNRTLLQKTIYDALGYI